MKNSTLAVAAARAVVVSTIGTALTWPALATGPGATATRWAKLHLHALVARSRGAKNFPSHETIFNHGLEQLAAVATWLDWAALAALLLMFFHVGYWSFSWLEMRALRAKDKK